MDATVLSVITIGGAMVLGAISPGPSFILVARTALASSRRAGMGAALGMGAGSVIISLIALMGLHTLLAAVPWLWLILKTGGGLYLLWMAFRMFRGPESRCMSVPMPAQVNVSTAHFSPHLPHN